MYRTVLSSIIGLIVSVVCALPANGHALPDGVIFRGIQVVVREDKLELRYLIGLNEKMVRGQLVQLKQEFPEDASDADLLSIYREYISAELPKKLQVTIDDKPVMLQLERADIVRKHHADIECLYELDISPTETPEKLTVVDNNFKDMPGDHSLAIRGRGRIELLRSNSRISLTRREPTVGPRAEKPENKQQRSLEAYYCLPAEQNR